MTKKLKKFAQKSRSLRIHLNGVLRLKRCHLKLKIFPLNLLAPFIFFALTSCQTGAIRYDQVQEGQWTAKVLIHNKKTDRSYAVKINVNAQYRKRIRLDITHTFKGHLASLVLDGSKIHYLLVPERKFYAGKASSRSLQALLPVPIHPKLFYNLFFDRPIGQKGWACLKDKEGYLSECKSDRLKIRWANRKGVHKNIFVDHKRDAYK